MTWLLKVLRRSEVNSPGGAVFVFAVIAPATRMLKPVAPRRQPKPINPLETKHEGKSMASVTREEKAALLGQMMAMQVSIRALVASNPGLDEFKLLLPIAREEALGFLEYQARDPKYVTDFANVSLHLDHLLYILTSGLFGERPGAPI
jgi:hypothetical protein